MEIIKLLGEGDCVLFRTRIFPHSKQNKNPAYIDFDICFKFYRKFLLKTAESDYLFFAPFMSICFSITSGDIYKKYA